MVAIILIAFGLSMDAFAVSITNGMTARHLRMSNALRIAIYFGSFQAFMPLLGWLIGLGLSDFIVSVDHWIAFGLLSVIGLRMIYESLANKVNESRVSPIGFYALMILSISTSIDALAVGVSFALINIPILIPMAIIGAVTFFLSFFGVFIGNRFGRLLGNKFEILGGLILIGIGFKILIEHLA